MVKGASSMQWLLLLPVLLSLCGCHTAVLSPAGPVSEGERTILLDSLAIMLCIVVPTIVATLAFAYWFRASNTRATYLPQWAYSGRLELIVWSIPALVIFFLGGIAWISAHLLDPAEPLKSATEPLEVEVVSLDWKWLFIYPRQSVASINRMVVPVGVPLSLRITSATVFNVFFVPQLGSEIYSMYGMTSRLNLEADRAGDYFGLSAHFSGDGFPGMAFDVQAVSPQEFTTWVAAARGAGPVLNDAAYQGLLTQSQDVKPYSYRAVRAGLFEDIVGQRLPPGEGPATARRQN
ncbi:MAG TPA: ubiquinol oxidase subunit II [Steroidobacteraceae bacterium]|jgi:cytochrome o ubiquinol oxidase subunit 2|nr:ubiquinol oxidase subunit II [Steroidobacteraceae bacterium]